ncbi:MAG: helix-turn-helix transcriptional regulator [Desulfobacterales bacterium]
MNKAPQKRESIGTVHVIWSDKDIQITYLTAPAPLAVLINEPDAGEADSMRMLFCFCGRMRVQACLAGLVCECMVPENYCDLHLHPIGCCSKYEVRKDCQGLLLSISRRRLMGLIAGESLAVEIQAIVDKARPVHRVVPVTLPMRSVLSQIIQPALPENLPRLYYLAKILELICAIESLDNTGASFSKGHSGVRPRKIYPADRKIVENAKNFLAAGLDNPPSIADLAGKVGVSASKLKQLFPEVCGMTPYDYLRKIRMEKAMLLLRGGEMNVTEAAYEVGYESISHFSKVFCKYYGIKPSQVRNHFSSDELLNSTA